MLKTVLAALTALFLTACGAKETILHGMPERDANEIVSVLYGASIEAQKVLEPKTKSFAIMVREGDAQRATAVLAAVGLPHAPRPAITDLFKSNGFAPTPFEERVRFIYGITQELERTLSLMNGVLQARVHVVIPEQNKKGQTEGAKASVLINYDERFPLELETAKIRRLVAESIEGLDGSKVELYMTPVKVDIKKVSSVPLTNFAGIRVHQDDFNILLGTWAVFVAIILGLGLLSARLLWKKK